MRNRWRVLSVFCGLLVFFAINADAQEPKLIVQTGHSDWVISIAFSPDGELLASGSFDHSIKLWNVGSGNELRTLTGHSEYVTSVAFSPDGKLLASGSFSGRIKLWDGVRGDELRTLTGHSDWVRSVAFSPDGKFLASGSQDKTIRLWDVASGNELLTLTGHSEGVCSIVFNPDAKLLVSCSEDNSIKLWDVKSGKNLRTLTGHSAPVTSIALSPNGKMLVSCSDDKTIKLWDVQSGKNLRSLNEYSANSVALSPDGKLLADGSSDNSVKLWDVQSGREQHALTGHSDFIWSIAFSPNGKVLASSSSDKTIKLWDVANGKELHTLSGHAKAHSIAFSSDGKMLVDMSWIWDLEKGNERRTLMEYSYYGYECSYPCYVNSADRKLYAREDDNHTIKLRDMKSGEDLHTLTGHSEYIRSMAFSRDGKLLASASSDKTIKLWDVVSGDELYAFAEHSDLVNAVAFSPDGKLLASGSDDKTIKLWDVETGNELRTLARRSWVNSVAFSPDGKLLVSGNGNSITFSDAASGNELRTLEGHTYSVNAVAFSPDGKLLASGSNDKTIKLWDVEIGNELRTFTGHPDFIRSVAFSLDGKTLVSHGGEKITKLWDVASGKNLHTSIGYIWGALNPDGRLRAYESDNYTIKLSDTKSGKDLHILTRHSGHISSVVFSPNSKLLASASWDKTVKLWDVASGKELHTLIGHTDEVRSVAFSPDGKILASGSNDKTIKLWDVASGKNLLTFILIDETDWVVIDADGRFDASPNAQKLMYWRVGNDINDIIELEQLKARYYEPGLLQKIFGYNKEPMRKVKAFTSADLPPKVTWTAPSAGSTQMTINLTNRGGGIGPVQVLVNGKEAIADARPAKFNPDTQQTTLPPVDLKDAAFIPGAENHIEVVAWNYDKASHEGYVSSPRGPYVSWTPPGKAGSATPELYAIIGGISDYAGDQIDLHYAAKDAEEFAHALELGAAALLTKARVHIKLLATGSTDLRAIAPTKENFRKTFEEFRKAKPTDILIVYLAGHGITLQRGSDLYLYLTQEARSTDAAALSDKELRESISLSSDELVDWTNKIKANKQVMILDTCAAGAAAASLMARRDLPSDQIRALDRLKDRTGFFVLMGSAADAVSYEANRYGQGLLTYALLQAMKGAGLREGVYADVNQLFNYAVDMVPQMARNIGGIQRPIIIAPQAGSSFDIGRFTTEEKAQIKLAQTKLLILRPRLQNSKENFDDLKLEPQLRAALREASFATARGQSEAALVYVDADEMAEALTPSGSYVIEGDRVKVTVKLIRNDKPIATVTVEGNKNDKEGLIKQIIQSITQSTAESGKGDIK